MIFINGIRETLLYDGNIGGWNYINGVIIDRSRGILGAGTIYAGNEFAVAGYYY